MENKENVKFVQDVMSKFASIYASEFCDEITVVENREWFILNGGVLYCIAKCNQILNDLVQEE